MIRLPPTSTPFPYTTLFRSHAVPHDGRGADLELSQVAAAEGHVWSGSPPQHHPALRHDHSHAPILGVCAHPEPRAQHARQDRKSTRLNSSHTVISYAVFCLK